MTEETQELINNMSAAPGVEEPIPEQPQAEQQPVFDYKLSVSHAVVGSIDIPISTGILTIGYVGKDNCLTIKTSMDELEENGVSLDVNLLNYAPVVISFGYHVVTIGRSPFIDAPKTEDLFLSDIKVLQNGQRKIDDQLIHINDRINIKMVYK